MMRSSLGFASAIGIGLAILATSGCGDSAQSNDVDRLVSDINIPTQAEADAQAAREITEENADEVFRRLEREVLDEAE